MKEIFQQIREEISYVAVYHLKGLMRLFVLLGILMGLLIIFMNTGCSESHLVKNSVEFCGTRSGVKEIGYTYVRCNDGTEVWNKYLE